MRMDMKLALFGADVLVVAVFLLVLVFTIGVVWRVEKELDVSYKCFALGVVSLALGEIIGLAVVDRGLSWLVTSRVLRLIGSVFFLASVLLMRDIVRVLDHEKPDVSRSLNRKNVR